MEQKQQMILKWFKDFKGEQSIKAEYKRLLKLHHPDKHSGHTGNQALATEKTKIIIGEYQWLEKNGWNLVVQQEYSSPFAAGGRTNVDWMKEMLNRMKQRRTSFFDIDEDVDWRDASKNPFEESNNRSRRETKEENKRGRSNSYNPFSKGFEEGSAYYGFDNRNTNQEDWLGGFNEPMFKRFIKEAFDSFKGITSLSFESYYEVNLKAKNIHISKYNEWLRKSGYYQEANFKQRTSGRGNEEGKKKDEYGNSYQQAGEKYESDEQRAKRSKDSEFEEMIQLVNQYLRETNIASIREQKDRIKATVLAIMTKWLVDNKEVTIKDFERLQKALGIPHRTEKATTRTTDKDYDWSNIWFQQFMTMFNE